MHKPTKALRTEIHRLLALLLAIAAVLIALPAAGGGGGSEGTTILPCAAGLQLVCRTPEGVDIFPLHGNCPPGTVAMCVSP